MRLENYFTSWRLFEKTQATMLDELGARAAALENDLAFMKGGELRPMTETVPSVNSRGKSPTAGDYDLGAVSLSFSCRRFRLVTTSWGTNSRISASTSVSAGWSFLCVFECKFDPPFGAPRGRIHQ